MSDERPGFPSESALDAGGSQLPQMPVVPWRPAAPEDPVDDRGWPAGITIEGVLKDTFARYGADAARIFLVGLVPTVLQMLDAEPERPNLLVGVLSVFSTAVVLVLADRGPGVPILRAARVAAGRLGWLIVAFIVVGLIVGLAALLPGLIIVNVAGSNVGLLVVLGLLAGIPIGWVFLRLVLAIPAVVVDDIGIGVALGRAREATPRLGVVVSLFVIVFLVSLAAFPIGLGIGAIAALEWLPEWLLLVLGGVVVAIVAPLPALAQLSAYRRAFPPEPEPIRRSSRPEWSDTSTEFETEPVKAVPDAAPGVSPAPPPRIGRVARGLIGLTLAGAVTGTGAFVWAIGASFVGAIGTPVIGTPATIVPPGSVLFGPSVDLSSCGVREPFRSMPAGDRFTWVGAFEHQTKPTDRIRLEVKVNGVVALDQEQVSGTFDCLGNDVPERLIGRGLYEFSLYVNGARWSKGTLAVSGP